MTYVFTVKYRPHTPLGSNYLAVGMRVVALDSPSVGRVRSKKETTSSPRREQVLLYTRLRNHDQWKTIKYRQKTGEGHGRPIPDEILNTRERNKQCQRPCNKIFYQILSLKKTAYLAVSAHCTMLSAQLSLILSWRTTLTLSVKFPREKLVSNWVSCETAQNETTLVYEGSCSRQEALREVKFD